MDWIVPKNPLKNGLFVRSPLSNVILRILSKVARGKTPSVPITTNPKKILLCNIANFGDVVISTTVLPVIKKQFPDCEIGFLTSSTSAVVLEKHPLVSHIHNLDHWYLQRHLGLCKAVLHYWKSRRRLLKELKRLSYDLAIDLYCYFPNAATVLAKSGIPIRIGYTSGGYSKLFTHPFQWRFFHQYTGYAHLHLLTALGIDSAKEKPLPFYNYKKVEKDYIVAHMGSSHKLKEWDVEKWVALILRLEARGETVVLTGKGAHEGELCQFVAKKTRAKDVSNQLDWEGFVSRIQEAKLLISVDSSAVHIAAGSATPILALLSGMHSPHMWTPPMDSFIGMIRRVPCAPCWNSKGCLSMACIKDIEVEESYQNALKLIKKNNL